MTHEAFDCLRKTNTSLFPFKSFHVSLAATVRVLGAATKQCKTFFFSYHQGANRTVLLVMQGSCSQALSPQIISSAYEHSPGEHTLMRANTIVFLQLPSVDNQAQRSCPIGERLAEQNNSFFQQLLLFSHPLYLPGSQIRFLHPTHSPQFLLSLPLLSPQCRCGKWC